MKWNFCLRVLQIFQKNILLISFGISNPKEIYKIYKQSVWKTRYNLKDNSKVQAWFVEKLTLLPYSTLFSIVWLWLHIASIFIMPDFKIFNELI